ncbi:Uncharacterised protein [Legionella wadsworthii]|uniref:Uncharacterized protein n=1 Tax=Legionella wadsworthii TaxID=28088 RepID=A0A378LSZ8_9GAMM|nr:hypothetical protein [Legionella wadsworthii]STY29864.1 Uncharacterised protein [Legionella wadsworthii]
MLSKFFSTDLPVSSREAFEALKNSQDLNKIQEILSHFNELVHLKNSTLTSLARSNPKISNNQIFIMEMETRFHKLRDALQNEKPYKHLFGDLCQLKEDLQVILRYYQKQIDEGQPIAADHMRRANGKYGELRGITSKFSSQHVLSEPESDALIKYTLNFCASDVMKNDIAVISEIIQKPHLADHSRDSGFSYFNLK